MGKKHASQYANFGWLPFDVLENAHVGITPGIDFGTGGEGYVRFSYANSLENIQTGLGRISQYLSRCGF